MTITVLLMPGEHSVVAGCGKKVIAIRKAHDY